MTIPQYKCDKPSFDHGTYGEIIYKWDILLIYDGDMFQWSWGFDEDRMGCTIYNRTRYMGI